MDLTWSKPSTPSKELGRMKFGSEFWLGILTNLESSLRRADGDLSHVLRMTCHGTGLSTFIIRYYPFWGFLKQNATRASEMSNSPRMNFLFFFFRISLKFNLEPSLLSLICIILHLILRKKKFPSRAIETLVGFQMLMEFLFPSNDMAVQRLFPVPITFVSRPTCWV